MPECTIRQDDFPASVSWPCSRYVQRFLPTITTMRAFLICLLISAIPAWAHAAIVKLQIRPHIQASAEYLPGQRNKPAVLLLHGFNQTRDFTTVASLAHGLQDAGYPVLAPTLSLGIPNRRQSLACEAVHRHTMEDDVAEIARWVNWLKSQDHRSIVLVGHSFGSLQALAYLDSHPDPVVKGFLGASLIETQIGNTSRPALKARLENMISHHQRTLVTQQVSYCTNYLATPEALLSYVNWDQARTLKALNHTPVSALLIMGDADEMLGKNWIATLKHARTPMVIVAHANHFMDGEHEFDLLEHTLKFLEHAQPASTR